MQTTTNYGLKEYEGTDLFNPLTVENVNTASLDTIIKAVSDSAVGTATEYLTANVHTLTRDDTDRPVFHFVATSNYTAGDVFVVDGQQVTAHTPDGQSLSTGAFIIGAGVLCVLDGAVLTLIVNPAKALDADQLDGHDSTYFATADAIATTNTNVDTLSNKIGSGVPSTQAQTVIGAINEINNKVNNNKLIGSSAASPASAAAITNINTNIEGYKLIYIQVTVGNNFFTMIMDKEDFNNVGFLPIFRTGASNSEVQVQFNYAANGGTAKLIALNVDGVDYTRSRNAILIMKAFV